MAVTYLLLTTLVTQISNAIEYRFDVEGRKPMTATTSRQAGPARYIHVPEQVCKSFGTHQVLRDVSTRSSTPARSR